MDFRSSVPSMDFPRNTSSEDYRRERPISGHRRDAPIRSEKMPSVTILVIGPTQNGKSTFINRLLSLSDSVSEEMPAEEGDGNLSCTTKPRVLNLIMPVSDWKFVNRQTGADFEVPADEDKIFSGQAWRRITPEKVRVVPTSSHGQRMHVRIIDTPGLDDSKGRDFEHLGSVLSLLNQKLQSPNREDHKLTALVFVYKSSGPFSKSFQQHLITYKNCMPNLFNGLSLINTDFNLNDWSAKRRELMRSKKLDENSGSSSFDHIKHERRKSFKELLGLDPTQFYINSKPNPQFPLEELRSRNSVAEILNFWRNANAMEIGEMRLVKSPEMIDVDSELRVLLHTALSEWDTKKRDLSLLVSKDVALRAVYEEREQDITNAIARLNDEIKLKDNDSKYTIKTYTTTDDRSDFELGVRWVFRVKVKNQLRIDEPHVDEFQVDAIDGVNAVWTSKLYQPGEKCWIGKYEAKAGDLPRLNATSHTVNRVFYRREIELLRRQMKEKRDERALVETERIKLGITGNGEAGDDNDDEDSDQARLQRLVKLITDGKDLSEKLKDESPPLSWAFDEVAQARYRKNCESIDRNDLYSAARSIKPELERGLRDVLERLYAPRAA